MSYNFNSGLRAAPRTVGVAFDQGLRKHMIQVYNHMSLGLIMTGLVAWFVGHSPALLQTIYGSPLRILVMLAPLAFVLVMSFGLQRLSLAALTGIFYAYSATMGLSLSFIFIVYAHALIGQVFFVSAAMFLAMSLYGYTTRADLSRFGSFLFMGLIGIVVASLVNLFLMSSGLQFVLSVAGVLVFTGLTAYDTQRIKEVYFAGMGPEWAAKSAIMGALTLYLDFINLFMMLLQLFGDRRSN
jgi:FtsH-binding integral membrane protein